MVSTTSAVSARGRTPLTLRIETDHQEVDELVSRLDSSSPEDPGHAELLRRTFDVLDHDVRTEEDELLPRLQQVLTRRQLRVLGMRWELVRRISPTRPHPLVSRRPPGQTLSALPLTVLDRARDRAQWLDERTGGPVHVADLADGPGAGRRGGRGGAVAADAAGRAARDQPLTCSRYPAARGRGPTSDRRPGRAAACS